MRSAVNIIKILKSLQTLKKDRKFLKYFFFIFVFVQFYLLLIVVSSFFPHIFTNVVLSNTWPDIAINALYYDLYHAFNFLHNQSRFSQFFWLLHNFSWFFSLHYSSRSNWLKIFHVFIRTRINQIAKSNIQIERSTINANTNSYFTSSSIPTLSLS